MQELTEKVIHLKPDQEKDRSLFQDKDTGVELEVVDKEPLVEWLANNYSSFGASLEFVTDRSQEGSQFVKGFGGIGGLLRWSVDFTTLSLIEEGALGPQSDDDSDEDDYEDDIDGDFF